MKLLNSPSPSRFNSTKKLFELKPLVLKDKEGKIISARNLKTNLNSSLVLSQSSSRDKLNGEAAEKHH